MKPHIYEGTPEELAPFLLQHPDSRFRIIEITDIAEQSAQEKPALVLSEKARAAISLLDSWIAEGKAADQNERIEADQEVEEFKRSVNANRLATGERTVYP